MLDLGRLLCDWSTLKILTLSGYCDPPRILGSAVFSENRSPSYSLVSLSLDSLSLADSALMYLISQNCFTSLMILELFTVSDLDNDIFRDALASLGSTLLRLSISIHSEDGDVDEFYEPSIFTPLKKLENLDINSDYFEDAVLDTVVSLPSIETISLNLISFSFVLASAALNRASPTLRQVVLSDGDTSDSFWSLEQRWTLGKSLNAKGIDLSLNHADFEDIDDGMSLFLALERLYAVLSHRIRVQNGGVSI